MFYQNWLQDWLELYVKPTTKTRTYVKYVRQIEQHILPQLGSFELDDLSALTLQRFAVGLSEKGLSANTVNGILSLLKSSLRRAAEIGIVREERTNAVVRPKGKEKRVE